MKSVQVASGVGVLPIRTLIARLVSAGTEAAHVASTQVAGAPGSRTRDRNVPEGVYGGDSHIQSTDSVPAPTARSLATGRIESVTAREWDATCTPSTEYLMSVDVQSMR